MRNHSYENEFDLHENGRAGETHFHTKTRFDTEAKANWKWPIVYIIAYHPAPISET